MSSQDPIGRFKDGKLRVSAQICRAAPECRPAAAVQLPESPFGTRRASSIGSVGETIGNWLRKALDPYRPELHYMRGPGPKWPEKPQLRGGPRLTLTDSSQKQHVLADLEKRLGRHHAVRRLAIEKRRAGYITSGI